MNEKEEAKAFDEQITERINGGHIPDLRCNRECLYFYNNSWRHPDYVKLDMQEQYEAILKILSSDCSRKGIGRNQYKILEVGCGPGWLSLELYREGFNVTGVELSVANIKVAKDTLAQNVYESKGGALNYICGDIFALTTKQIGIKSFDCIVFAGALHHFNDPSKLLKHLKNILSVKGIIIAHEPTRDKVSIQNAAYSYIIKKLLSLCKGYYQDFDLNLSHRAQIDDIYNLLKYQTNTKEKLQSINDNEAGYEDIQNAFMSNFKYISTIKRYGLFHEIIGGLRFSREMNSDIAKFIRDIDRVLVESECIEATEYLFTASDFEIKE